MTLTFIQESIKNNRQGSALTYIVKKEKQIIGVVCIHHPIDVTNKMGKIGYWIDEKHSQKGYATTATRFIIDKGFVHLDLDKLELHTATTNLASNRIAKKLGFTFEGVKVHSECLYGRFVDHNIYSLMRDAPSPLVTFTQK